jgi:hypothetical protein
MTSQETSKQPEDPGVEVLEIPSDKLDEAVKALKPLLGDGEPDARLSGTGCRHTTGGDLHCGDTDNV